MATYQEIEEKIIVQQEMIKEIQRMIDSNRERLSEYDEEREWVIEDLKKEQVRFNVYDDEFWTIEYCIRDLVDRKIAKAELDKLAYRVPSADDLCRLIPVRYARQAVRDMRLRGGN